jgi:hypothetical protein
MISILSFLVIAAWGFAVLRYERLYRWGVVGLCFAAFSAVVILWFGISSIGRAIATHPGGDPKLFLRAVPALTTSCYVTIATSVVFLGLICFRLLSLRQAK